MNLKLTETLQQVVDSFDDPHKVKKIDAIIEARKVLAEAKAQPRKLKTINLGMRGFKIEGSDGIIYGTKERAEQDRDRDFPGKEVTAFDSRPTVQSVCDQIDAMEAEALGLDEKQAAWTTGPWNEYFSFGRNGKINLTDLWPDDYTWVAVYVVTGGSEGLYLHIDLIGQPPLNVHDDRRGSYLRHRICVAKTLDCGQESWLRCWESAARIAYYLGA